MYPEKLQKNNIYFYTNKTCFNGGLHITRGFIEKDYNRGMHEQEFYEINIVVKGNGMHYILDNKIATKVGDVFILPPYTPHGYYGEDGFDVYHILLSIEFANKYFSDLHQLPSFYTMFSAEPIMRSNTKNPLHLSLSANQFKTINSMLNELLTYSSWDDPFECSKNSAMVMMIITQLCEIYSYHFAPNTPLSKDEYFMKTISYMHQNYQEKISLDYLVKLSQMSRSSYLNKFKQICKMPPLAYLNKIRLDISENLLLNSNISVAEIAFKIGFYDFSHFTKSFEKEKGVTPATFRKSHLK